MLCDTYQGGTVAAATPLARRSNPKAAQRVGEMDAALPSVTCSFGGSFAPSVRAGLAFSEKPDPPATLKK